MTAATLAMGTKAPSKIGAVLRVTSGNFLEQFDFFLFGFYATYIAKAFFPAQSEFASLMLTFGAFAAGFLMRPLGAIVLGAYIDKVGRRKGLIVTLSIMATGTILIAFVPGYATIGLAAPLLVLTGRLLQGFSAGAELGGVSVYLAEMATPGPQGVLYQLAIGKPASRHRHCRRPGLCASISGWRRATSMLGAGAFRFLSAAPSSPSSSSSDARFSRPKNSRHERITLRPVKYFDPWPRTGRSSFRECCSLP